MMASSKRMIPFCINALGKGCTLDHTSCMMKARGASSCLCQRVLIVDYDGNLDASSSRWITLYDIVLEDIGVQYFGYRQSCFVDGDFGGISFKWKMFILVNDAVDIQDVKSRLAKDCFDHVDDLLPVDLLFQYLHLSCRYICCYEDFVEEIRPYRTSSGMSAGFASDSSEVRKILDSLLGKCDA